MQFFNRCRRASETMLQARPWVGLHDDGTSTLSVPYFIAEEDTKLLFSQDRLHLCWPLIKLAKLELIHKIKNEE